MKICPKCGAPQKNSRSTCIDCGARLGRRLSAEAQAQYEAEHDLDNTLERLAERADDFHIGFKTKLLIILNAASFLAAIGILIFGRSWKNAALVLFPLILNPIGFIILAFPRRVWAAQAFCFKLRALQDELSPTFTDYYIVFNKIIGILATLIGAATVAAVYFG